MSEPTVPPERLAALLDGRLDEAERRAVLAQLADADEGTLEALADAAAVLREGEAAAAAPKPVSVVDIADHRGRRRPLRTWGGIALIAAVLAGIVVLPRLGNRGGGSGESVPSYAAQLSRPDGGLPPNGLAPLWSTSRSGEAAVTANGRAVRVGVRLADLDLARRAGDLASSASAATEVASYMDAVPAGAPAAGLARAIAADATAGKRATAAEVDHLRDAASIAGASLVSLGAWLETARAAAAGHDAAFFAAPATREALDSAVQLGALPTDALAELRGMRTMVSRGEPDFPAVQRTVDRLIALLGD